MTKYKEERIQGGVESGRQRKGRDLGSEQVSWGSLVSHLQFKRRVRDDYKAHLRLYVTRPYSVLPKLQKNNSSGNFEALAMKLDWLNECTQYKPCTRQLNKKRTCNK